MAQPVFCWKSSSSSVLAMSSAEAELIALCACAADVASCRKLANELGFLQLRPTIIHEDNVGAKTDCIIGKFQRKAQSISIFAGGFFITTHQSGHRPHQSNKTRPATC
jgi:hypothetical protein